MKVSVMVAMAALGISLVGVSCGGGEETPGTGGKGGTSAGGKGGSMSSPTGGKGGSTGTGGTAGTGGDGTGGTGGSGGEPIPDLPKDELVLQYKFNEGTGTTIMDSSGKGNNGNLVEGTVRAAPAIAAPTWVDGQEGHGKAYSFDGTNDFAIVPDSESIDSVSLSETVGMSLAAWVKFSEFKQAEALSDFNFVICRQETARPGNEYFGLGLKNGRPMVTISHFFTEAPDPIPLNTWTHIAMSYVDGLTVTLYVNGVLTAEMGAGVTIASDSTPITIGAAENNGVIKEFVRAQVDDLYIYSRPLTGPEIKAVMAEK